MVDDDGSISWCLSSKPELDVHDFYGLTLL
jgi:hypothetical protein